MHQNQKLFEHRNQKNIWYTKTTKIFENKNRRKKFDTPRPKSFEHQNQKKIDAPKLKNQFFEQYSSDSNM